MKKLILLSALMANIGIYALPQPPESLIQQANQICQAYGYVSAWFGGDSQYAPIECYSNPEANANSKAAVGTWPNWGCCDYCCD